MTSKTVLPRGFAGSFDDQVSGSLDLNPLLIQHPAATYFMRVDGNGLVSEGAADGDIVIVDRSLTPLNEDIVVVVIDGAFMLKQLNITSSGKLLSSHFGDDNISLDDDSDIEFWGVVTASIRQYRR